MKIFPLVFFLFSISSLMLAQEPATFTVEVPVGTQSVRMTGEFWGWNPIGGPVASDNGDNTWTITLFAGGGDSQSDMEYKWVIVDSDNVSNPIIEDLIDIAKVDGCTGKIDAGELNTDKETYANRVFVAAGNDDDKFDVYDSCGPYTIDVIYDELVWFDEFNTAGKNAMKSINWHHQTQFIQPGGWANGEVQHYTNRIENSFEENGNLNIVAIKESFTDQGETKQYTSARLNSKFAFTYGRVDVRAKLPIEDGTWPAIWTLGKNINEDGGFWASSFGTTGWPACGEIDIMEHGLSTTNHVSSALHTPCCNGGSPNVLGIDISDVQNNYHVYSVNWSPNQMTFMVDDEIFYIYKPPIKNASTWPFDADQYILLNIAMGGIAGTIDLAFTQSAMEIDYVRVYQNSTLSNEEINATKFRLFPNPTSNYINIESKHNIDKVELYDILGNQIEYHENLSKKLDVSGLKSGIYLLVIYSNNIKTIEKLVKK